MISEGALRMKGGQIFVSGRTPGEPELPADCFPLRTLREAGRYTEEVRERQQRTPICARLLFDSRKSAQTH